MSTDPEIIDLTASTYTLVNHCNLSSNEIIVIEESDTSFVEQGPTRFQEKRKSCSKIKRKESLKKRFTVTETPEKKIGECPICCEQLGKKPVCATKCGHVYCLPCITTSLKHSKHCPQCRQVLKGASAFHPLYLPLK